MKLGLLLLSLACAAMASPAAKRPHGRPQRHHVNKKHKASASHSSSSSTSTLTSVHTASSINTRISVAVTTGTPTNSTAVGTSHAPTATSSSSASGTPCSEFLRGVNIGGWLLLDSTLNANTLSAANAKDQWTFDSSAGAAGKLDAHWKSYFTEADMKTLKAAGINAIKIPIGYWAWDNSGTPYIQGADAYLEKAIGWAAAAGIKVWIDVSNTGSSTATPELSIDSAKTHSLSILTKIATKYGASSYADTVAAIQIFSSPLGSLISDLTGLESFVSDAFKAVRTAAKNPNLQVIVPDANGSPKDWISSAKSSSSTKGMLAVAESMTELTCPCEQEMTQTQHIQDACQRGYSLAGLNHDDISIYVGDFNPATNATMHVEGWTDDVITDVRKYVEANLEVFEAYTSGYFFWSWAQDSDEVAGVGWGFKDGLDKGYIPSSLNDPSKRKYPGQCDA